MSELVADMEEEWTLEAIVRGSSGDFCHTATNGQDHFFDDQHDHQMFDHRDFPSIFEVSNSGSSKELEELYKPFYTASNNNSELTPARTVIDFQQRPTEDDVAEDKPAVDQSTGTSCVARVTTAAGYTPKYKRRKNQHKRVVMQVSAEGLASDMWAWRKYGQKPIKGSPYPRSYYRCSSSKGCLARKQVEQSFTDEGMFIVTYTAEHSHSQPTRRNSLAGTVRQKFPSHQNNKNVANCAKTPAITVPEKTEESAQVNSHHARIKEEENRADDINGLMSDFVYDDDFFSGFKDFDDDHGFAAELPVGDAYYETQQYPVMSNCSWF